LASQVDLPGGGWVDVWHEDFPGDWVMGTSRLCFYCRIHQAGRVHTTMDEWYIRVDSPWHLELLVKTLSGWRLEGFLGLDDSSREIAGKAHYFMVLRRLAVKVWG
jgi:hypothetical protein